MRTLLVNVYGIANQEIKDKAKSIPDCEFLEGCDFKTLANHEKEYDKIVVLFDSENLDFASLLEILNDDKEQNKKFHLIINASEFDEDVEEQVESTLDVVFDFIDGVMIDDVSDLQKYILNYL